MFIGIAVLLPIILGSTLLIATSTPPSPFLQGRLAVVAGDWESLDQAVVLVDLGTGAVSPTSATRERYSSLNWSPDGRWLTMSQGSIPRANRAWVLDVGRNRLTALQLPFNSGGCAGWTADSRYALCGGGDQYGNGRSLLFDTATWSPVAIGWEDCHGGMLGDCHSGLAGVSPVKSCFVVSAGDLICLPERSQALLLPDSGQRVLYAAWSPDAVYLALVTENDYVLYLGRGDGMEMQPIGALDSYGTMRWASNARALTYRTKQYRYTVDVVSRQMQVAPVNPEQAVPQSGLPRWFCGDASGIAPSSLPGGRTSYACWSPDHALLAVGQEGAVEVYMARLQLLQRLPMQGWVSEISWAPIAPRAP